MGRCHQIAGSWLMDTVKTFVALNLCVSSAVIKFSQITTYPHTVCLPVLSWTSPLNSSFDQTKCISSCFRRCFSHHQLKLEKKAGRMRKNRGFHGCWKAVGWIDVEIGSCEDLIPPVRIHQAEAERSSDSPWIILSVKVGS